MKEERAKKLQEEQNRLFRINIGTYRQEIMMINGIIQKVPKHLVKI